MNFPQAKHYLIALATFVLFEGVSWFAWRSGTTTETIVTAFVLLMMAVMSWKRPTWLAYASVSELIVGGKGYLLALHLGGVTVSFRMALFVLVLVRALPFLRRQWRDVWLSVINRPLRWFVVWLAISLLIGLIGGHGLNTIYTDANAWLYLALLPAWYVLLHRDERWSVTVITILLAGASVVAVKSWLMVLLFGRDIASIGTVYRWIRQTGIGEITYINNNIYRVFFQSHIYTAIVFIWLLVLWVQRQWQRWMIWPLLLSGMGVYISLSRSLWLGVAVAGLFLVALLIKRRAWRPLSRLWIVLPIGVFAWAMMIWAISWPEFRLGGSSSIAAARFTTDGAANAATARQNQIRPLVTAIGRHPVIGSGFGQTVTYYSTDPTIHGWRTTTAFELGYLDLWLKLGAVGLLLFGWWMWSIARRGRGHPARDAWLLAGLTLLTVHLTSPYLNHPLGLGWMMMTILMFYAI